eukprot:765356-Hanusia_phi.AAC.3
MFAGVRYGDRVHTAGPGPRLRGSDGLGRPGPAGRPASNLSSLRRTLSLNMMYSIGTSGTHHRLCALCTGGPPQNFPCTTPPIYSGTSHPPLCH